MVSAMVATKPNDTASAAFQATEVGMIPVDWQMASLGSLTTLMTNGFVGPAKKHYVENQDGILYVQGYNVRENSFDFHGIKYVSREFHSAHMKSCLEIDDLLTVQTGDVGLTTVVSKEVVGANCHALIISRFNKKKSNPLFVSYYMNSVQGRSRLRLIEVGTTMKHLNVGDMLHFKVPLPPSLLEQSAVAEALSDADALIESLEQLIDKKREIKQGAMQELLTGKRRLANSDRDWTKATLGSLAKIQRGASPRPIDDPRWFDENSKVGWVRISDVTSSTMYLTETTQKLSPDGVQKSRPVPTDTLIMSICATVGRPIITKVDVCIHDGFVVFDELRIDRDFLYYVLTYLEKDWSKHGQTGSQMNLNTNLINATEIRFPHERKEQELIASALLAIDDELTLLNARLSKAQQIKQGMMQELLTGRIRLV
jgi:type I restriction enzyme, S subunit